MTLEVYFCWIWKEGRWWIIRHFQQNGKLWDWGCVGRDWRTSDGLQELPGSGSSGRGNLFGTGKAHSLRIGWYHREEDILSFIQEILVNFSMGTKDILAVNVKTQPQSHGASMLLIPVLSQRKCKLYLEKFLIQKRKKKKTSYSDLVSQNWWRVLQNFHLWRWLRYIQ